MLHALAGCLTLTIVNVAAARKVTLTEVSSTLSGVLDARGATGLDDSYRNGFERIRVSFQIKGDAPPRSSQEIVERAKARSVVYDIVSNPSRSTCTRRSASHVDGAHRQDRRRPGARGDAPSGSRRTSPSGRPLTTATAATRSRASTRCGAPGISPLRCPTSSAASA